MTIDDSSRSPDELVSAVVPAFNNQETITQCVDSLLGQDYGQVEVIVVDDGSTDATSEKVISLMNGRSNLRLVRTKNFGPSHARNVGIRESNGKFILFADADASYDSDYLREGIDLMQGDSKVGGVCVTGTIWIKKNTFVSRGIALEYEMKQRFLKSRKWKPYFAFLYRKEAVDRVGGFDEELFQSEDKDLFDRVKRAGYRIGLVDGFHWVHLYPQDVSSLITRSYRGGKQRVVWIVKRKLYRELLRRTSGLWALIVLGIASIVYPLSTIVIVGLLAVAYAYKAAEDAVYARGIGKAKDVLLLPLVSGIRYLTSAMGYTKGSLVYLVRWMRGLQTSWSDL